MDEEDIATQGLLQALIHRHQTKHMQAGRIIIQEPQYPALWGIEEALVMTMGQTLLLLEEVVVPVAMVEMDPHRLAELVEQVLAIL